MNRKRMTRVVSVLMLLALLIGVFPMTGVIGVVSAETGTGETDPEVTEATGTDALDVDETEIPEDSLEASPTDESETTESTADEDGISWLDADLLLLVNGQFIPYNPTTGEADIESSPNGTRAMPSGIYYSDVLGAHGSDLNGYNIKAGGIYDSWVYGTGVWYPYSTGVVATTGRRVITSKLYCNDGPSYYKTESGVLAIPIRPSQESGWSMDVNGYGDYTTRSTGVPTFKNESLYSKYVPTYSAATWTQINLIYGVAKGMGGMTSSGNANITAAASTLICNTVWGYIGLGSDKQFHGKPIMTSSSAVNQQMAEILVRCEVYSKEKNVTGTTTGDNTLNALRAKGFTPTDTTGWYVASGTAASTAMGYFQINRSQSNGIKDVFDDCGEIDCMYIETSREEYEKWHSEYQVAQSKRKCGADFTSVSLSEPCSTARGIVLEDTISDGFDLEKEVIDRLLIEELRHALKKLNDWAPDLFDYYLAGKYSTCTKELIEKWGVSKPIVAKRKRQLNAFIKNYLA